MAFDDWLEMIDVMDEKLIAVLVGVVAGAAGYWINVFWMKPLLQYRELRTKVFSDFIFYAQVVNAERLNDRMKRMHEDRIVANRRNSADLAACLQELPGWYKKWLSIKGLSPNTAVVQLIGYSNAVDYSEAEKRERAIKKALGLPADSE